MYRKVTLLVMVAIAVTLAAATVSMAAPPEKRTVCQEGVTKEVPIHAKAKGATEGPCEETPPPTGGGDLAGLTATPEEFPGGTNINALLIYGVAPFCAIAEATAQLTLERDGIQYTLSRENNPDMTWHAGETSIRVDTHMGQMQFELADGTLTELPWASGDFTIVSSTGITCS